MSLKRGHIYHFFKVYIQTFNNFGEYIQLQLELISSNRMV